MRVDDDHRIVSGAAAQSSSAWIEHAVNGFPLIIHNVLSIPLRPIGIMPDPEVPAERFVLRRIRVKSRDLVILRQAVWTNRAPALEQERVSTGLEQEHLPTRFRQPRRH